MKKEKAVEKRTIKMVGKLRVAKPRKKAKEDVAPANHREYMLF